MIIASNIGGSNKWHVLLPTMMLTALPLLHLQFAGFIL